MTRALRICFVSLFYPDDDPISAPLLRKLPAAMAERGHDVSVLHLAPHESSVWIKRVRHRYVPSRRALHQAAAFAGAVTRRPAAIFEWPRRLAALLSSIDPDVVHVHGTQQHLGLARLRHCLPGGAKLVIHYHGGTPADRIGLRGLQRRNLHRADAVLFTTRQQAESFVEAGMLADPTRAVLLVETSSDFRWMDRRAAREETGMHGRPVYLSAARLHPVKDPMTMLDGFERIAAEQPEARLYLYYLSDELLPEMQAFVADRPALRRSVEFRGRAGRAKMEAVFNSADLLLQASLREFSGCALLDAMACGVVPVVTDLPSFRVIAERHGAFFRVGDADDLARRSLAIPFHDLPARSADVRDHFERELSFEAMARKLEAVNANMTEAAT